MRKFTSILLRLIFTALVLVSGFLLLKCPVTVNVQNVRNMAKVVIKKNVDKTGDSNLKGTLRLAKDFGVEDKIIDQLPKKYQINLSYESLYNLSVNYQANGQVTAKSLKLPEKNQVQKAFNYIVLDRINSNLEKNPKAVSDTINIFHYFVFAVILIFILAALLVLFGKFWATIILLIASLGSFGVLQFYTSRMVQTLQIELYKGISLTTSTELWIGLAIGLITALAWPFILKLTKKKN